MLFRELTEPLNPKECGYKAFNLYLIKNKYKNYKIPRSIVGLTQLFDNFVEFNSIPLGTHNSLKEFLLNEKNPSQKYEIIKNKILQGNFPTKILEELYSLLPISPNGYYAVRSSYPLEDSKDISCAGLFHTELLVQKTEIPTAIKKVFASLFEPHVLEYLSHQVDSEIPLTIAILIQEMILDAKYGVAYFYNDEEKRDTMILESILGEPQGITSGSHFSDLYIVQSGNLIYKAPNLLEYDHLFEFELKNMFEFLKTIQDIVYPIDMEWAIKDGEI
jgi:phosphoenolpyruvate synthase/pyruvate phosphate dikinase